MSVNQRACRKEEVNDECKEYAYQIINFSGMYYFGIYDFNAAKVA